MNVIFGVCLYDSRLVFNVMPLRSDDIIGIVVTFLFVALTFGVFIEPEALVALEYCPAAMKKYGIPLGVL